MSIPWYLSAQLRNERNEHDLYTEQKLINTQEHCRKTFSSEYECILFGASKNPMETSPLPSCLYPDTVNFPFRIYASSCDMCHHGLMGLNLSAKNSETPLIFLLFLTMLLSSNYVYNCAWLNCVRKKKGMNSPLIAQLQL